MPRVVYFFLNRYRVVPIPSVRPSVRRAGTYTLRLYVQYTRLYTVRLGNRQNKRRPDISNPSIAIANQLFRRIVLFWITWDTIIQRGRIFVFKFVFFFIFSYYFYKVLSEDFFFLNPIQYHIIYNIYIQFSLPSIKSHYYTPCMVHLHRVLLLARPPFKSFCRQYYTSPPVSISYCPSLSPILDPRLLVNTRFVVNTTVLSTFFSQIFYFQRVRFYNI